MVRNTSFFTLLFLIVFSTPGCDSVDQTQRPSNPILLVSIDGFMNEYLDRNETPNFDRFIQNGTKAEYLIPVFPTKTFPTHWTIATGLYTENHGIITNSFYDYELDARFSYGPQEGPNDERWWGGEPIWVTAEKQGKTAATFFWPGSEASINGVRPTKWMDYDGSVPDSVRIDSVMTWLDPVGDVQADFSTLYFSFVDSRGHAFGPNSPEVDEAVREMDDLLGHLLNQTEAVGLRESLNIILVSDHGMAELSEDKIIFLEDIIDLNDVDVIDWTPVAMLRPKEGKTEEVYRALKEHEENYSVFLKDEMPERFRFSNHYRIPEIIMMADMSYTITSRPFFEQRGIIAATHGYDNMEPEMRTFFAAGGPDFKQGVVVDPFESVHIYELMAYLLRLEPASNDGDPEELLHLLRR
ncbi:MAG: alkaline phosphatase family protein [Balneolaceae bacterium]|nr:MAG: alkaline phosphatase family protein [Balneolaceae bacterium]